jgi:photosystem II stability/assembly factor-like uncharacterized protein
MNKNFSSFRIVVLSSLFLILFHSNVLPQNYWERTSGPGTVTVYDFIIENDFILIGTYHGGIYKSTDGGENWQQMNNELINKNVYALERLPNRNILAGTSEGIHISSDNGETWFYSVLPDYPVSTITIDETDSIYIGSYSGDDIYRSGDNGITWYPLNSGIDGVISITIKNLNTIIVSSSSRIYRSSDRGSSWTQVFAINGFSQSIDVTLNKSGNFAAISDLFYLSTDEGVTWDSISTLNHATRKIYCSLNGDLYAGSYGVYRSMDEGQTWNLLNGFQGCGLVRSIAESGNSFYAGAYFSGVFKSTDSGYNWIYTSKGLNNSSVTMLDKDYDGRIISYSANTGFAYTTDNGFNWSLLSPMGAVTSLAASPNGSLFASSGGVSFGVILRSTDSGYNWNVIWDADSTISQVNVNLDESVYAIVNYKLFKSTNNGDDWFHIQVASPNEFINSVTFNSIGYIYIQSSSGYFRSSDNGGTWVELTLTPEGLDIFGISKSDEMYATASDSCYYSSTDYGNSWTYLSKGSGKPIRSFASNNIGYLFILEHFYNILRSTDDGISWQEINSGLDSASVNCLIITNDDYLLAGTGGKGVYRSVNKTTSIDNSFVEMPNSFFLEQNYPNPFNPITKIKYSIPSVGTQRAVSVQMKVYDVLGNEIATLVNEEKPAGIYEINFDGTGLSSGIYFYQLRAGYFTETRKMILLK